MLAQLVQLGVGHEELSGLRQVGGVQDGFKSSFRQEDFLRDPSGPSGFVTRVLVDLAVDVVGMFSLP